MRVRAGRNSGIRRNLSEFPGITSVSIGSQLAEIPNQMELIREAELVQQFSTSRDRMYSRLTWAHINNGLMILGRTRI